MSSATPPARRRNTALVVVDIVVSVIALLLAFGLGLLALGFIDQINTASASCSADGTCNTTLLGVAAYGLLAVSVLAFFLGLGFAIVRFIQKRYTFPLTIGAFVVMLIGYYAAAWIVGMAVAPA